MNCYRCGVLPSLHTNISPPKVSLNDASSSIYYQMLCENVISIWSILIISQDKLFSPYHGSSAELVMVGVEPGTLRFQVDVITHYTTALQLIEYMPSVCSMSLRTELCIVLSIERVLTEHSCRRCRVLKTTSSMVYSTAF